MHNLAIALHRKGFIITGSDDEIYDPARSQLASYGLLPPETGWFPEKINPEIDLVILGMHARPDNPELLKSQELGLKILSFPEFLYEQSRNKKRIVVAGSHGKTTVTSMIIHVFRHAGLKFDYMVGSTLPGFETMVGISYESTVAVFEGDEYPTSALDKNPKFLHYKPDIAILNGIAWDHMNIFKTFDEYTRQFRQLVLSITQGRTLLYFSDDPIVKEIAAEARNDIRKIPYKVHGYFRNKLGVFAATHERVVPVKFFGEHNMQNLSAAKEACLLSGVSEDTFYDAIKSFEGASGRLQKLRETDRGIVFYDFAHAPSKVKATIKAVSENYPDKKLIACLELHTYSSLSRDFLPQYKNTMVNADEAFVYFNPHTVEMKRLPSLSPEEVVQAFGNGNIRVFTCAEELFNSILKTSRKNNCAYLFMSSGNFSGYDLNAIAKELV